MDTHSNIIKNQTERIDISTKTQEKKEHQQITCYLGLGSNIGDAIENIRTAISYISKCINITIIRTASYYQTKPWGNTNQQDFINTVVEIQTLLTPDELLLQMQKIESDMGRIRKEKWGPRIIDIDILLYSNIVVNKQHLKIPHPFLTERLFVLVPLSEINKNIFIPGKGQISEYICDSDHKNKIKRLDLLY